MLFSINCLEKISLDELSDAEKNIAGNCDFQLYKCLKSKRFFFNDFYIHNQNGENPQVNRDRSIIKDFFGPHINVQAIVGENGSGKSSIMELMYMMINNFSYMFERGHDKDRPGADSLYYIPGLFARLYFSLGNDVFKLESKGLILSLYKNDEILRCFIINENTDAEILNNKEIADLVDNFFYTIVTNYSIQSFIPTNYIHDVYYYNNNSNRDCLIKKQDAAYDVWINSIFHKNDGYVRSVVLNPYRNNGHIDISNELNLSKDRSCALFLWAKQKGYYYFKPYVYNNLRIKAKENFLKNKIKRFWKLNKEDSTQFDELFPTDDSCLKIINTELAKKIKEKFKLAIDLNFDGGLNGDNLRQRAVLYLQLKILTIINRYDVFLGYRECVRFEKNIKSPKIEINEEIDKLLDALKLPDSHITKKLTRTFSFLKLPKNVVNAIFSQSERLNGENYFDELSNAYVAEAAAIIDAQTKKGETISIMDVSGPFAGCAKSGNRSFTDPVWIDRVLPPSIFDYDLILEKNGETVNFADLSSGELQMLETLSVHSYHIENLISVQRVYLDRNGEKIYHPKYKCINMVFDEVEMCFHPDYQRQFLNRLLDLIVSMKQNLVANGGCYLNIMIITHSPFLLSDVPKSNILYLEKGCDYTNSVDLDTFGSNISDTLYNSFFLKSKGFIGEFAKQKIRDCVKFLDVRNDNQNTHWNRENVGVFINKILGEPIIKNYLRKMLSDKFRD